MKIPGTSTPKYFNGVISDSGIEDDLTEIVGNWEEVPFWQIVEELCTSGGRDAYVGVDFVFNYFVKGSRKNTTESVMDNINLIDVMDYAKDTEEVATKVRVYGKKIEGIPILATSAPNTKYTKGIVKEVKIDNSSIVSTKQALELANATAQDALIPPNVGTEVSTILPTLFPGEIIWIASPINNISPAFYSINSFKHSFNEDGVPETELVIKKHKVELATILKSNIKFKTDIPENLNNYDMDFSHVIQFNKESGSHANTEINKKDGVLKVKPGASSGTWISDVIKLNKDVSAIELRMTGDSLIKQHKATTSVMWFSLDGGTTFNPYIPETIKIPSGRDLKIRIDLNSADAIVKAVSVLYKQY